ncbi:MAG TPA: SpoIIE family protein phosphatase [Candidatus Binatia bacterium]
MLAIGVTVAIAAPFHAELNNTTVALALVLAVLFVATLWGRAPGILAAVLGMLCFNFFFLPPVYTFTIADPQNWVALTAFLVTASIAGHLSVTARRRAAEAEAGRKQARLANAYNRSLIEASLDPLVTIGPDGKITDLNVATEQLIGYSRKELIGTEFSGYFTEPEKAKAGYQHAFQEGLMRDYALEFRHRGGHMIPVLYNASVYRDEAGEIIGVVGAAHDISERQRAESEIRLLARLQTVVASLGQWALRSDRYENVLDEAVALVAQTLGVEYCNVMELLPGGEEFLLRAGVGWKEGYVGRERVGGQGSQPGYTVRTDRPVIVHDAAKETRFTPLPRLFGEEVVSAISVVISTRQGPYGSLGAHTRHRRTFTPDEVNFLQSVANVLGADIERKRAEEAVKAERQRFNDLLDTLPAYLILLSPDYHVPFANRFFRERFGESHGKRCFEYLFGRAEPCEICHTFEVLQTMKPLEWEWTGPDGRNYYIYDFPFTDTDGSTLIMETGIDITERKRAEAQLIRINRANRALSRCNQAVIRAMDEPTLLQQICQIIVEDAGYRLCWVGQAENDQAKSVRPIAQAGFEEGYLNTLNITWADTERGRGPTGTCIRTRQTMLTNNIATDPKMIPWRAEALKRGYASSISIPLVVNSTVFGSLSIYAAEPDAFVPEEISLLTELANDLAFGIATLRARIQHERAEEEIRTLNAELEQRVTKRTAELQAANLLKDELLVREQAITADLETAREREAEVGYRIQQTLLLDQPPTDVPWLRIAALTIPSQRIDGDFYVFFKHPDQRLDVIVGDVMGKGVPAALLGAATKSHFIEALSHLTALSKDGTLPEPKEIVTLAHAEIARHLINLENFVTLCYARLDLNKRVLDLVDCGHTGIIHLHGDTGLCEMVHGENLPLGIREGEIFNQISVPFGSADVLLFYSDGVTEARNAAGDLFGADRLVDCVTTHSKLDPEALVETIRNATLEFSGSSRLSDDLTCVVIKIEEPQHPLARAELQIRSDLKELRRAREFVRLFCHDLSELLDEATVAKLELAVNEAASNIMKHAYQGRADQLIDIDAEALPTQVSVRLHHLGDPFDPSTISPPALDGSQESGFGIYLISQSVDAVRYYRDERGKNCIALTKLRPS